MAANVVVMSGADHPTLGDLAFGGLGEIVAVAISPGRLPKHRPSLDPNEDAALVAAGPHGVFAVVIDGHFGFDAASAALSAAARWADALVGESVPDQERAVTAVLTSASTAIREALAGADDSRQDSRCAVSVALGTEHDLHLATVGDTTAVVVRRERRRWEEVGATSSFLGPGPVRAKHLRTSWQSGDRLVLTTDGVTDFVGADAIERVQRAHPDGDARSWAAGLAEAALMGGAGDHVTAVCVVHP